MQHGADGDHGEPRAHGEPGGRHAPREHGQADYGFIISLDTQGSSGLADPDRPAMRARIYDVAESAFAQARIADARLFQEDRGDGLLAVLAPRSTERVAGEWIEYLHQNLRAVNRDLKRPLRLRAGFAIGPVTPDRYGFSGAAVDLACRIGNCGEAKAVLAAAPGSPLLVAVTDQLYHDVIRHGGRWIEPDHYRQYEVSLQEGPQRPWFMVPGLTDPPLPGRGDESAESGDDADSSQQEAGERRPDTSSTPNTSKYHFGPVTHHGSGQVLQGKFGDLTFDNRQGYDKGSGDRNGPIDRNDPGNSGPGGRG